MNAHEVHALSGAYAVDALDPVERAQFEEHLASCTACQAEVASLREATALLGGTVQAEPPAALRDRLLAETRRVRPLPPAASADEAPDSDATRVVRALPLRRRLTALVAAASLVGVAGAGAVAVWQQQSSSDASVTDRVLQAADAERVTVDLPGGASASVIRSVSEGRAVLVTRDLPPAPSGRVYELWLRTPAGVMVPAGLVSRPGSRPFALEGDATRATAAGITVEPEGGSESPTSDPIALFDFEDARSS